MSAPAAARGGARLARAKRVVVKIGSALLVEKSTGRVNRAWLETLAADVAALRARGQEVVIVSSGAIALGRRQLGSQGGELGRMGLNATGVTPMQRARVGSSGEEWSWVDELAPSLEIDEQSLWSVLQRAAQEGGLEIRFESAAVEQRARETVLHGPALAMPPRQALDAVLVTTAYRAEPDGDGRSLLVRPR